MKRLIVLIFALFLLTTPILAQKLDNCRFSDEKSVELCKMLTGETPFKPFEHKDDEIKLDVHVRYANQIILSGFAQYTNRATLRLMAPSQKVKNAEAEIAANRNLVIGFLGRIVSHLKNHKKAYKKAEKKYGVNREFIAAILAKESALGTSPLKFSALSSLMTLFRNEYEDPVARKKRYELGKRNLGHLVKYCQDNGFSADRCGQIRGSYAGAVGFPQFMPQNFHRAVSFTNNMPNLSNHNDAILSIGSFFEFEAKDQPEVKFSLDNLDSISEIEKVSEDWYRFFRKYENQGTETSFGIEKYKCFACKNVGLAPYRKMVARIMTYNNTSNYAVGVLRLAHDAREVRLGRKKIKDIVAKEKEVLKKEQEEAKKKRNSEA